MTLKQRILAALARFGPQSDAELAEALGAVHQAVNQAARQLAESGAIRRIKQPRSIVNILVSAEDAHDNRRPKPADVRHRRTPATEPERLTMPPPGAIALVSCVGKKGPSPAPAQDLYASPLFQRQREWATARCDTWFILSGKHGLLRPEDVIEPYDLELKVQSRQQKREWSEQVLSRIQREFGSLKGAYFEIYAGAEYHTHGLAAGLRAAEATVVFPWEGLGIGQRLARTEYLSHG